MFFPLQFESLNKPEHLPPGEYAACCSIYEGGDPRIRILFFEYSPTGTESPVAADLVVLRNDGSVSMRDFMQLPDNSWRDSYGLRSDEMASLLPVEIFEYPQVATFHIGTHQIGES